MNATNKKVYQNKKTKRYYGLTKIKVGQKIAWVSAQNKFGQSLGLALNNRTIWLRNIRFNSSQEVGRATRRADIVFVELKGSK